MYLFSDWPKAYSEFSKSVPVTSSSCRLYNNHVKGTQGHGYLCHVEPQCMICSGKRTELSPIRSVIIQVITKSDDWAAGVQFVYHKYDIITD